MRDRVRYLKKLCDLYEPIRSDLRRVEESILRELRDGPPHIRRLSDYVLKFSGKRLRPAILLCTAQTFGRISERHVKLATIVEIIHNATLVHDDVLDEALIRHRIPTMQRAFGNEQAIIFGDTLFARAFALCAEVDHPEAFQLLTKTTLKMCTGESLQLAKKFEIDLPLKEYLEIIELKTAALFECAARFGALGASRDRGVTESLAAYGRNLGVAFQMIDDLLDVTGRENVVGKSLGTDITKGKMTLPVILLLERLRKPELAEVRGLIESVDHFKLKRRRIRDLVREHRCDDEVLRRASLYALKAKRALTGIKNRDFLIALADFVIDRAV